MFPSEFTEQSDFIETLSRPLLPVVQCHSCGFEPPVRDHPPRQCPKCHGGCWERFVWRGKLDDAAPKSATNDRAHG